MRKAPKHKIILIIGLIFFAASPFLFWFAPQWFTPLLCIPDPYEWFPCVSTSYMIAIISPIVSLLVGTVLILVALRIGTNTKK